MDRGRGVRLTLPAQEEFKGGHETGRFAMFFLFTALGRKDNILLISILNQDRA